MKKIMILIIIIFSFLLNANTLSHDYARDDITVTTENSQVKQGISAIPEILSTRYRHGHKGSIEPLYRPLSVVLFAIEWEIAPNKPWFGHLLNIILFAFANVLLFQTLLKLLGKRNVIIPFVATLIFIAHPVHTEVVANIKSSDEILCFLFVIASANALLNYIDREKVFYLLLSLFLFFLSLLSKENAITFVVIVPLLLYFFRDTNTKRYIVVTGMFLFSAIVYLNIRQSVLGTLLDNQNEIPFIDNSLMLAPDLMSRFATAMYMMGKYLALLFFPYKLTSEYSYACIPNIPITNIWAILSTIIYVFLFLYAIVTIKKKTLLSFGILFFLITISLVSNVFFLIDCTMAERFLFLPSLGFCLAIAFLFNRFFKLENLVTENRIQLNKSFIIPFLVIGCILVLFSLKTYNRNLDWKNNETLIHKDLITSKNNVRNHFAYAQILYQSATKNPKDRDKILQEAIQYFKKGLDIYKLTSDTNRKDDTFAEVYLNIADCYTLLHDKKNAPAYFLIAADKFGDPNPLELKNYMLLANYLSLYKYFDLADRFFNYSLMIDPDHIEVLNDYSYSLAIRSDKSGIARAEGMSRRVIAAEPDNIFYLGTYAWVLYNAGKYAEAQKNMQKALAGGGDQIGIMLEHYGDILFKSGDTSEALKYWNKAFSLGGELIDFNLLSKKIREEKIIE